MGGRRVMMATDEQSRLFIVDWRPCGGTSGPPEEKIRSRRGLSGIRRHAGRHVE